jgi:short-subunit dehydrogenase
VPASSITDTGTASDESIAKLRARALELSTIVSGGVGLSCRSRNGLTAFRQRIRDCGFVDARRVGRRHDGPRQETTWRTLGAAMSTTQSTGTDTSSIDQKHLLIVGAGPGLGAAIGRRFASGGYHVTLLARSAAALGELADRVAAGGAVIDTLTADAGDLDGLRRTLASLYAQPDAPGLVVYSAADGRPDSLLHADVGHVREAYDVDVVGAVVATQVASAAMRAAGRGTILFTGGGFADHPVPALATLSLGKAALRSAGTILGAELAETGVQVATITIAGPIAAGTAFDPDRIAEAYWGIVHADGGWQSEFRFEGA